MFGFGKKKSLSNMYEREAILNMADLLMQNGFSPNEALKEAENFWSKHRNRLSQVM
jgi:hypothetical protein